MPRIHGFATGIADLYLFSIANQVLEKNENSLRDLVSNLDNFVPFIQQNPEFLIPIGCYTIIAGTILYRIGEKIIENHKPTNIYGQTIDV